MLTTTQKAPLLDQDGTQLAVGVENASSSDNAVAYCENQSNLWWVVAAGAGTCTVTANRSGFAPATLEVTVTEATFSIQLGTPEPK
jgi:hypothetical protein